MTEEERSRLTAAINLELSSREVVKEDSPTSTKHRDDAVLYWKDSGRMDVRHPKIPSDILDKVCKVVIDSKDADFPEIAFDLLIYAEYSKSSGGDPKLEPHYDTSDVSTLIFDYQLESNVLWPITVESKSFDLEDNSGLLFESLENIHYRPVKSFKDNDFVKMLFFRFSSTRKVKEKDYQAEARLEQAFRKYIHEANNPPISSSKKEATLNDV